MSFKRILESIYLSGGASFNVFTDDFNPREGYMVALVGHEKITEGLPRNLGELKERWDEYSNHDIRKLLMEDQYYLGVWYHDGKLYMDVVEKVDDLLEAVEKGQQRQQIAIYDNLNRQSIFINEIEF